MANYDVICPIKYPLKCHLSPVEKEQLEGLGKYTAFFMYQFRYNDPYLKESVERYFKSPLTNLLDASELPGTGVKLCKICKLILASDFGIAALTPINPNVFMELGILLGLGKPILYLVNSNKCKSKNLPFDISHEIVIEHTSQEELNNALQKEVPSFLEKVRLYSEFQYRFRAKVEKKLNSLTSKEREILQWLLLENRQVREVALMESLSVNATNKEIDNLWSRYGFVKMEKEQFYSSGGKIQNRYSFEIHLHYREILEELLFKTKG